jgi:hypothetical protein
VWILAADVPTWMIRAMAALCIIFIVVSHSESRLPQRSLSIARLATIIAGVGFFGFVVYVVADPSTHVRHTESAFLPAPRLTTPSMRLTSDYITVDLGRNSNGTFNVKVDPEPAGMPEKIEDVMRSVNQPFMGRYFPIRIYVDKDKSVYINTVVNEGLLVMPIPIVHNQLAVSGLQFDPNWDHNSNENALEIVDDRKMPVFQMIFKEPDQVIIRGVFKLMTDELLVINDDGPLFYDLLGPKNSKQPPLLESLHLKEKTLFRYPSYLYPGIMAEN